MLAFVLNKSVFKFHSVEQELFLTSFNCDDVYSKLAYGLKNKRLQLVSKSDGGKGELSMILKGTEPLCTLCSLKRRTSS
jgi:hypothetical protein